MGQGSLTRAGYIFDGWNAKEDGTGDNHKANASYTPTVDTTLYTQWQVAEKLYVSSSDSDEGSHDGTTEGKAFKIVQKTVDVIEDTNDGQQKYTIIVDGELSLPADFNSYVVTIEPKNITLTGGGHYTTHGAGVTGNRPNEISPTTPSTP